MKQKYGENEVKLWEIPMRNRAKWYCIRPKFVPKNNVKMTNLKLNVNDFNLKLNKNKFLKSKIRLK